jgi:hypothetical protein
MRTPGAERGIGVAARRDGQLFIFGGREMAEAKKDIVDVVRAVQDCGYKVMRVMKDIGMKPEDGEYYSIGVCRAAEKAGKRKPAARGKPGTEKAAAKRKGAK